MNLFTSTSLPGPRRSVLLAPFHSGHCGILSAPRRDNREHRRLLAETQRLRGRIYLADGAISRAQLTRSGRHVQAADLRSFHLLSLDSLGRVVACTRYLPHDNTTGFSSLGVSSTPLVGDQKRRRVLERAVKAEMARARHLGYQYVEMGGWAITEALRCSTEAVRMVVSIYALARLLGGALGISTVTTRHASSSILRRLGGVPLKSGTDDVSPYYDPNYGCEMEILRFDSDRPAHAFEKAIRQLQHSLARVPVVIAERSESMFPVLASAAA